MNNNNCGNPSAVEEQENAHDVEYAIELLARIHNEVAEEDLHAASMVVDAMKLQSCLELFLSAMEILGYNVKAMEEMYHIMFNVMGVKAIQQASVAH